VTQQALVDLVAGALVAPFAAPGHGPARDANLAAVREGLERARLRAQDLGLPVPEFAGQLYRPVTAFAGARAAGLPADDRLWLAALAIQLAHEASLLHDDVIDRATTRRGAPTTVERHGAARALLEGDHLLTAAYRVAGETRSPLFFQLFATAVERTVAGEKRQAAARGATLDWDAYLGIVGGKSGELFGCALAASTALAGNDPADWVALGRRVGSVYQMVDDLLDYCPSARSGKAPYQDLRAGLWTWLQLETGPLPPDLDPAVLAARLFQPFDDTSAMRRALARLQREVNGAVAALADLGPDGGIIAGLFHDWMSRSINAVRAEEDALARREAAARVERLTGGRALAGEADRLRFFAQHGQTFRFASRLFPREAAARVASVYAFCRLVDDLVDRQADLSERVRHTLLDGWAAAARQAYDGTPSGIPVIDAAMRDMATHRVPFRYAADLIAGVRMDVGPVAVASIDDLRLYAYRVASVVGLWLTELFGVREPAVLERAAAMGQAMQVTNILRDVGEDLRAGRLYLPASLLAAHGIDVGDLRAAAQGDAAIPAGYPELCEDLMALAERQYAYASEALPALPAYVRRPVAVAAKVYAGIHDAVRDAGYDNLRGRARTSLGRKIVLAASGLIQSRAVQRERALALVRQITAAS
jgi:phytoene synthase